MHIDTGVVCAIIGFVGASFVQRVIERTPAHEPVRVAPHCRNCGVDSTGTQKNSLLARLTRNRYCDNCDHALWARFPGVECLCAFVLGAAGATIGWTWTLPAYLVFFLGLTTISVIDLRHYLIPNRVIYPTLYATFLLLVAAAVIEGNGHKLVQALVGMACAWFFFFVVWFIYPRGMGFGDVRLSALIGLVSGWVSLGNVVLSVLLALLIGAAIGLVLIVVRLRSRKQAIPFGPFLALGATISVLWGDQLFG